MWYLARLSDPRPALRAGLRPRHVLALAATALIPDDRTAEAVWRLNRARGWPAFTAALRLLHAPHQTVTYADVAGNIGMASPGRVPVRRNGDGAMPVAGWTGDNDWTGFIPFDDLPLVLNPPSGRVVAANQRPETAQFLGRDWPPGYRARRIEALLDGPAGHDAAASASMQMDRISTMARDLLPLMLAVQVTDARSRKALALLARWDGDMDRVRPEPLIFTAWLRELNRALYADELGPEFSRLWSLRPRFVKAVLSRWPAWCDDIRTPRTESCAQQLAASLSTALAALARRHGGEVAASRWGDRHVARFSHLLLDNLPLLGGLLTPAIAVDGGSDTLNRGRTRIGHPKTPFAAVHGAVYRAVYDLAALDQSRFMIAPGQSGNLLSPHFDDLLRRWRDGEHVRLGPGREITAELRLRPDD
jgi:penicillin amidase